MKTSTLNGPGASPMARDPQPLAGDTAKPHLEVPGNGTGRSDKQIHRFNPSIAETHGIPAALIEQHLNWCSLRTVNTTGGWVRFSARSARYTYLGSGQIWRALRGLLAAGRVRSKPREGAERGFLYRPTEIERHFEEGTHKFAVDIAEEHGLVAAIIHFNIYYWICRNWEELAKKLYDKLDPETFDLDDDAMWHEAYRATRSAAVHYTSIRAWLKNHPYTSLRSAERGFARLVRVGLLEKWPRRFGVTGWSLPAKTLDDMLSNVLEHGPLRIPTAKTKHEPAKTKRAHARMEHEPAKTKQGPWSNTLEESTLGSAPTPVQSLTGSCTVESPLEKHSASSRGAVATLPARRELRGGSCSSDSLPKSGPAAPLKINSAVPGNSGTSNINDHSPGGNPAPVSGISSNNEGPGTGAGTPIPCNGSDHGSPASGPAQTASVPDKDLELLLRKTARAERAARRKAVREAIPVEKQLPPQIARALKNKNNLDSFGMPKPKRGYIRTADLDDPGVWLATLDSMSPQQQKEFLAKHWDPERERKRWDEFFQAMNSPGSPEQVRQADAILAARRSGGNAVPQDPIQPLAGAARSNQTARCGLVQDATQVQFIVARTRRSQGAVNASSITPR